MFGVEGPGQVISLNRWAYDMTGSGQYVRPDVFIDLGPGRRSWIDGKTPLNTTVHRHDRLGILVAIQRGDVAGGADQRRYEGAGRRNLQERQDAEGAGVGRSPAGRAGYAVMRCTASAAETMAMPS